MVSRQEKRKPVQSLMEKESVGGNVQKTYRKRAVKSLRRLISVHKRSKPRKAVGRF